MDSIDNFSWKFDSLPFYYTELENPNNGKNILNSLPFELKVDKTTGVLTQVKNDFVEETLTIAYNLGSVIAGVINEENENIEYANDFVDFFKESLEGRNFKELSILEIGSGTGFLLSQISKLGFKVLGVEPGTQCLNAKDKYNVEIIHDFFPTKHITSKFDIIMMTNVLEHIPEPLNFLKILKNYLTDEGMLIITVPDEEPFMKYGDISTLFHEHYSYFTKDTINNTLKSGGFVPIKERFGKYGGVLLRTAIKSKTILSNEEIKLGYELSINYKNKAELYRNKLNDFLINIKNKNQTLGVYVPSRFINTLHVSNVTDLKIRFFDDNPSLRGKYYPGFNIAIENKEDLVSQPVDILLIFSKAFGNKIKSNLAPIIDPTIEILTWEELFDV